MHLPFSRSGHSKVKTLFQNELGDVVMLVLVDQKDTQVIDQA